MAVDFAFPSYPFHCCRVRRDQSLFAFGAASSLAGHQRSIVLHGPAALEHKNPQFQIDNPSAEF